MKKEREIIVAFIGSLWIVMPLYLALHEGGHALVALLCGAKIVEFNIMEGYVIAEGGTFNSLTLAWFNIAGMITPVMGFTAHLIFYRSHIRQIFYRMYTALFAGLSLFSIGVWIVVPIKYMMGTANPNDDVTKFIEALEINPLVVAMLASLVMGIYVFWIWRKKVFQNGYEAIHQSTVTGKQKKYRQ